MNYNKNRLLTTLAEEDLNTLRPWIDEEKVELLHMPLERYEYTGNNFEGAVDAGTLLEEKQYLVYGHPRNASFVLTWFKEENILHEATQQWLHFAIDKQTADILESQNIPAIHPSAGGKSIDLLELIMRLNRIKNILYPTGIDVTEEMPALFDEIGVDYQYLPLFKKEGPVDGELESMQKKLATRQPDIVLVHSQQAAVRTLTAFPDLDYEDTIIIAANNGTANKLYAQGVEPQLVGDGTYKTLFDKLDSHINP